MGTERALVRGFELNYKDNLPIEGKEHFKKLAAENTLMQKFWSVNQEPS